MCACLCIWSKLNVVGARVWISNASACTQTQLLSKLNYPLRPSGAAAENFSRHARIICGSRIISDNTATGIGGRSIGAQLHIFNVLYRKK